MTFSDRYFEKINAKINYWEYGQTIRKAFYMDTEEYVDIIRIISYKYIIYRLFNDLDIVYGVRGELPLRSVCPEFFLES